VGKSKHIYIYTRRYIYICTFKYRYTHIIYSILQLVWCACMQGSSWILTFAWIWKKKSFSPALSLFLSTWVTHSFADLFLCYFLSITHTHTHTRTHTQNRFESFWKTWLYVSRSVSCSLLLSLNMRPGEREKKKEREREKSLRLSLRVGAWLWATFVSASTRFQFIGPALLS